LCGAVDEFRFRVCVVLRVHSRCLQVRRVRAILRQFCGVVGDFAAIVAGAVGAANEFDLGYDFYAFDLFVCDSVSVDPFFAAMLFQFVAICVLF